MLSFSSRCLAKRWFKPEGLNAKELIPVGTVFSDEQVVTHDMVNNRAQLGSFVISTPALAHNLHLLACKRIDDALPATAHSLTCDSELHHLEPIVVGETMKMKVKVENVIDNWINLSVKVTKDTARQVVATGQVALKIVKTE